MIKIKLRQTGWGRDEKKVKECIGGREGRFFFLLPTFFPGRFAPTSPFFVVRNKEMNAALWPCYTNPIQ